MLTTELRDQIATVALNGIVSNNIPLNAHYDIDYCAELSYKSADAMLEARSKTNTDGDESTTT